MNPLVQSAIDTAKRGETNKAIELLRQNLNEQPNDIEAWLVLATLVDEPTRKRQVLNRVLSLDATNQIAREMMLKMDRDELSAYRSKPISVPGPTITPPAASAPSQVSSPQTASIPQAPKPTTTRLEKPLVFKYPLFWRILMYVFIFFFGCSGLLVATQNVINSLPFLVIAVLTGLVAMVFMPSVEISEAGVRALGMFGSSDAKWAEIVKMKSNVFKRRLELHKQNGEVVGVSTQVSNYPRIVEIIRQRRPDLFGIESPAMGAASGMNFASSNSEPAFTGTKTFKKGVFAQYGVILLMIPLCLFGIWALVASDELFVGIGVILVGLFFMVMSLFSVNQIKVEPNKLITESFFAQKEYAAREIKDITMKAVRSRRGVATNFVSVQPVQGNAISLAGFPDGDEIVYGVLFNWWNTYQNR